MRPLTFASSRTLNTQPRLQHHKPFIIELAQVAVEGGIATCDALYQRPSPPVSTLIVPAHDL